MGVKRLPARIAQTAALFVTVLASYGCGNFVEYTCPPPVVGPVYGYKDCREAYKIYTTEFSFKLNLSLEGLQKVAKASVGTEVGNKAIKLAQDLDQINIGMQNEYVGACQLFNTGPCDPDTRERYYAELRAIREQNDRLREVYAKVQELEKKPAPTPGTLAVDPRLRDVEQIDNLVQSLKVTPR